MICFFQALLAEQESTGSGTKGQTLTEQILQCMETILIEASQANPDEYRVSYLQIVARWFSLC
jgi:hypothetical protein